MQTPRERAIAAKTLLGFLQSLVDERCVLELRDDLQVSGLLRSVDSRMNVQLEQVQLSRPSDFWCERFAERRLDYLFVKGDKIRYVQFDDRLDAERLLEAQVEKIRAVATLGRGRRPPPAQRPRSTSGGGRTGRRPAPQVHPPPRSKAD